VGSTVGQVAGQAAGAARRPAEEIITGVRAFLRGAALSLGKPGLFLLGILPAGLAFGLLAGVVITVLVFLPQETATLTWFADSWTPGLRTLTRVVAGLALVGGVGLVSVLVFTALTLTLGGPFYDMISGYVDDLNGVPEQDDGLPWWRDWARGAVESLRLALFAVPVGFALFLAGFLPAVGQTVVPVLGALFGGWMLALELSGTPFSRRGHALAGRRAVLRGRRWATLGFGTAVFVAFLIPLGAVLLMPAAVAGATLLAGELTEDSTAQDG
jgi:CysZ protein